MSVVKSTRKKMYKEAKGHCMYCGLKVPFEKIIIEHKIPKSRGGSNVIANNNLTVSCYDCNMAKGSKTIEEFKKDIMELPAKLFARSNKFRTIAKFYSIDETTIDINMLPTFYFEREGIKI